MKYDIKLRVCIEEKDGWARLRMGGVCHKCNGIVITSQIEDSSADIFNVFQSPEFIDTLREHHCD